MLVDVGWRRVVGLVRICSGYHRGRWGPVTDLATPAGGGSHEAPKRVCALTGQSYGPKTLLYMLH
jgi:hypothetical protein